MRRPLLAILAILAVSGCGGSTEPADPTVPASVVLSATSDSTYPGQRIDLPTATVYNAQHQVIVHQVVWTSADTSIAKIKGGATVQGYAEGVATATATAGPASADVKVHILHEPVSSVGISFVNPTMLYALDSLQAHVITYGPSGDSLPGRVSTMTSHQPEIATVSPSGMIHIHSSGIARIFYESEGVFDSASIYADVRRVARLTIVPDDVQLVMGQDAQGWSCHMYDASDNDLGNRPITWTSSDTLITQPTYCGAFPVSPGTATITGYVDTVSTQVKVVVVAAP